MTSSIPFFTREDIRYWTKMVSKSYNPVRDFKKKEWIHQNLSSKLGFWTDSVLSELDGWKKTGRRDFLTRSRDKFRDYLWLRILPPDHHIDLYFTLVIANDVETNQPGLVIKLDFQRESPKKLNFLQYSLLDEQIQREDGGPFWFGITDIEKWNWKKLINKTTSFVNKHLILYNEILESIRKVEGDYRVARICWNDNGWINPSGSKGKSTNEETFEFQNGFGYEEWLLDTSKLINGYHYGFLEQMHEGDKYEGRVFNIGLYAIDSISKNRYWIGQIKHVEVIDKNHALNIKRKYIKKKWYNEMIDQIKYTSGSYKEFGQWVSGQIFNIRFKPESLEIEDYELLPIDNPIYKVNRYKLIEKDSIIESLIKKDYQIEEFIEKNGEPKEGDNETSYFQKPRMVQVSKNHQKIQKALFRYLKKTYNKSKVTWEMPTGMNTRVDIARKEGERMIFYEIKTYTSLRLSIREGFGQLLEYAHWLDRKEKIDLVIVSDLPINSQVKKYMSKMQSLYKIPISYSKFDLLQNILVEYNIDS